MSETPFIKRIGRGRQDGTSQAGRPIAALAPETFAVDERTLADWLRYLREYSRHLIHYNAENLPAGDWSGLIPYSDSQIDLLAEWLREEGQANRPCPVEDLRPHVALLLSFLKMLEPVQARMNEFTRRHLDYHTRELLRLTPKPAAGGRVHVWFKPVEGQADFLVPAGTLLDAGRDDRGAVIRYETERNLVVNQTRVSRLISMRAMRRRIGLRDLQRLPTLGETAFRRTPSWWNDAGDSARENTFLALLQLSLGHPDPGDPLPPYRERPEPITTGSGLQGDVMDEVSDANRGGPVPITASLLHELAEVAPVESASAFARSSLLGFITAHWPLPVFRRLMQLRSQWDLRTPGVKDQWNRVNALLGGAKSGNIDDFETNLNLPPGAFDGLEEVSDIYDLDRRVAVDANGKAADPFVEFVNGRLKMTVIDFKEMMGIVNRSRDDWRLIRDILRRFGRAVGATHVDLKQYQANRWEMLLAEFQQAPGTYPTVGGRKLANWDDVYSEVLQLESRFFMPVEEFARIRAVHGNPRSETWEWDEVFRILNKARFRKDSVEDRADLMKVNPTATSFRDRMEAMAEAAIGRQVGSIFDLNPRSDRDRQRITQDLHLEVVEFESLRRMIPRSADVAAIEPDWQTAAEILTLAKWRRQRKAPQALEMVSWDNLYCADDATRVTPVQGPVDEASETRWRTLGDGARSDGATVTGRFGLIIASPLLALSEGDRTITLVLKFASEGWGSIWASLDLGSSPAPFSAFLSTDRGLSAIALSKWSLPTGKKLLVDDLIDLPSLANKLKQPDREFDTWLKARLSPATRSTLANYQGQGSDPAPLQQALVEEFNKILEGNSSIYEQQRFQTVPLRSETQTLISQKPQGNDLKRLNRLLMEDAYLLEVARIRQLRLEIRLGPKDPKVEPLPPGAHLPGEYPLIQLILNEQGPKGWKWYDLFQNVSVVDVQLEVTVVGLQKLAIENDDSVLDPKKPFDLFGGRPSTGSRFRFAHREICTKALDSISVGMEYQNLPKDPNTYYDGYSTKLTLSQLQARFLVSDRGEEFPKDPEGTAVGSSFRVGPRLMVPLLDPIRRTPDGIQRLLVPLKDGLEAVPDEQAVSSSAPASVRSWSRHWILELGDPDFQHAVYPAEMLRVALENSAAMAKKLGEGVAPAKAITLNPPYTPRVKKIRIDYTAKANLTSGTDSINGGRVYHVEPFGYLPVNPDGATPWRLLPQWDDEGTLLIGLEGLQAPQSLSLLLQMADGGRGTGPIRPTVRWSCLDGNVWRPLEGPHILQDTTRGLLNSGVVEFQLDPVAPGSRMPPGLLWIRVTADQNADAIPDLIGIHAQAVRARPQGRGNTAEVSNTDLIPGQITGLVNTRFEVEQVLQPYSSFGGRRAETAQQSQLWISERLRHKDRALTAWDYERLVLEAFPEILQANCLPANSMIDPALRDRVQVLVIPDLRNRRPFDPFAPSLSADTLTDIQTFLEARCPSGIPLLVRNPRYVPLQIRLSVRLRPGNDPAYYRPQLNEAISRFLAPWAFGEGGAVAFGISRQRSSPLVHFVEQLPYVDYVAQVRRFVFRDGDYVELMETAESGTSDTEADVVLVSDTRHEIDFVGEERYDAPSFEGIGYQRIEYEFLVA